MPLLILIAEDDPGILLALSDYLELSGYTVLAAENGDRYGHPAGHRYRRPPVKRREHFAGNRTGVARKFAARGRVQASRRGTTRGLTRTTADRAFSDRLRRLRII